MDQDDRRPRMTGSPQSIKSQTGYSPSYESNRTVQDDIPVSQLQFCTQVYSAAPRDGQYATTAAVASDNTNAALLALLQGHKQVEKNNSPSNGTDPSDQTLAAAAPSQASSVLVENPEVLVPVASEPSSQARLPVISAPRPGPSTRLTEDGGGKHDNEHEVTEDYGGTRKTPRKPKQLPVPQQSTSHTQTRRPIFLTAPAKPLPAFQRWREKLQGGRYIPRYLQIIPKDQEQLLTSSDSWQPPLVGRPSRLGQVPLPLLERMTRAAKKPAEVDVSRDASPGSTSAEERPTADKAANKDGLSESEEEKEAEDLSQVSSEAWPPSPPTQDRRMQLPPNSPPLLLHPPNPALNHSNHCSQEGDVIQTLQEPLSGSPPRAVRTQKDSPDLAFGPDAQGGALAEAPGLEVVDTTSQSHHGRPSTRPATKVEKEEIDAEGNAAHSVFSTDPEPTHRQKDVQVERTPYFGKDTNQQQFRRGILPSGSQEATVREAPPVWSGCVPATIPETGLPGKSIPREVIDTIAMSQEHMQTPNTTIARDGGGETGSEQQDVAAGPGPPTNGYGALQSMGADAGSARLEEPTCSDDRVNDSEEPSVQNHPDQLFGNILPHDSTSIPAAGGSEGLGPTAHSRSLDVHRLNTGSPRSSHQATPSEPVPDISSRTLGNEMQTRTTRKRANDQDMGGPSKRWQTDKTVLDHSVSDKDYSQLVQGLRAYRRDTLSPLSKPRVSTGPAATSSPKDVGTADIEPHEISNSVKERHVTPMSAAASQASQKSASTPITHVSTYDDEKAEERSRPHSPRQLEAVPREPEMLFATFKAAYPEYEGGIRDFAGSCSVLSKILASGQVLHPSLFDDAIFHHYHSYRRYLSEEALDVAVPLAFYDFYNDRIEEPSHAKRIVTRKTLQNPVTGVRDNSRDSATSIARERPSIHWPEAANVESRADNRTPARREDGPYTDAHKPADAIVERWRQDASQAASPELGTPDVDRRLSDIPALDISGDGDHTPALTRSMGPPTTKKKRSLPWDPEVMSSRAPARRTTSLPLAPKNPKRPRPSASPFVKPAGPLSVQAPTSNRELTSPVVPMPQTWWTDPDTPFKRFVESHSKLESRGTRQELHRQNVGPQDPNVGGIDVFSWRR
ncbi:hypothetical protein A1O1_01469 [Capronia coronata CBS 617.96]|uniref:Uncharacterized protein n=1 Tax=Capronia coronata CBS 617.96 TaxID=1182541 RepID=W9YV31_9EURO|nr:uncharacterized protein A1O1_01469 [Capronia coronata CBS 617.96]EXJ96343.1 hypothetical protein A1O1_01469 [Capronia coronata CBS 617.96]